MKNTKNRKIRWIFGLVISTITVIYLVKSIDIGSLLAILQSANIWLLLLGLFLSMGGYAFRALRWLIFFTRSTRPSMLDSYRCLMIGFFTNNIFPARMGELIRAYYGGKATGYSRMGVLATIAGERLADGLAISLLFVALFSPSSYHMTGSQMTVSLYYASLFFAIASTATVGMLLLHERIFYIFDRITTRYNYKLIINTLEYARKFIVGLRPIIRPKSFAVIAVSSILVWLNEMLIYNTVAQAFGISLDLSTLSLFLAVVNFSSLIPSAPGGIGVIELFTTTALTKVGLQAETALALVMTQHIIQMLVVGIPGFLFLLSDHKLGTNAFDDVLEE